MWRCLGANPGTLTLRTFLDAYKSAMPLATLERTGKGDIPKLDETIDSNADLKRMAEQHG